MDAPPVRNLHKGAGEFSGKLAPCRLPPVVLHWPCLSEDLPSPGWLKWDETDLVSPRFFFRHTLYDSPKYEKRLPPEGKPFSMVWFRDRTRCYSRMIPASRQVSMVSSSQVDT